MGKAQHLVVDSGGFLKNADIRNMGEKIYTVKEVVSEIRDKATRQRLSVLPYEICFMKPSPQSIHKVTEAAKRTGDFGSLSSVDMRILALTAELADLHDPQCIHEVAPSTQNKFQFGADKNAIESLPGFYVPEKHVNDTCEKTIADLDENEQMETSDPIEILEEEARDTNDNIEEPEDEDQSDQSDEDDEGWITPGNIDQFRKQNGDDFEEDKVVKVACVTTDFAMQNVLMKMALDVFSVDGLRIKTVRSYVLRCHACFNITKIMTKVFCPKCGNNTLKRVPTTVQPDGSVKYYLSRNPKVLNKRGKKHSLPMPKGGKHAQNPILCEDQPVPQNRVSKKALRKTDVWSDEYGIDGSPFSMNDTESRAFKLGIRKGYGNMNGRRRNPNAVNQKFVKRR